jgi:MFS family permease
MAKAGFQQHSEAFIDSRGRIYDGWRVVVGSLVGLTFGQGAILMFCLGVFVPEWEREFGWGIGTISFGATLNSMTAMLSTLIAGYLVDRLQPRTVVLWSIIPFGLAVAALSQLTANISVFYTSLICSMLLGMGVSVVVYNKATSVWFDKRLGLSLGLANAGLGLGAAILPALVGLIIAQYDWRTAYIVLGALAIALPLPVAWLFVKSRPPIARESSGASGSSEVGLTLAESSRTREFWLSFTGFSILGIATLPILFHMVRILMDSGMSAKGAATLQSVLGVALIIGRVTTGWFLDRFRLGPVMMLLSSMAALALMLFAMNAPFGTAVLCAVLAGFVVGAEFDILGFLVTRYFGRRAFGVTYGILFAVFQISGALAIAAVGQLREIQGSYAVGLSFISALMVVAAVCFARLGPYRFAAQNE